MQKELEDKRWGNLKKDMQFKYKYNQEWQISCMHLDVCVFTWYGKLATQMSKNGRSVFSTSPTSTWSLACKGLWENSVIL